jgi:formylglycine-generating enzyme required for sulfatase activity
MVYVPGGSFQMGGVSGESDETPVHKVTLTGFYMGNYEVTQVLYEAVMGTNPSYFSSAPDAEEIQWNRPVENVSWYDAIVFCNKFSITEGLSPVYRIRGSTNPSDWGTVPESGKNAWNAVEIAGDSNGYRLPTEAQWEYAAKGGNGSPGNYTYSGSNTADDVAWYSANSGSKTHEAGKKSPNGLGIYDMSGNVAEWCWDWYGGYTDEAQADPVGADTGSFRMVLGGFWNGAAASLRSAYRNYYIPHYRSIYAGFRLVRP